MTDFGKYLTDYLNRYLTMECGCSYQTVKQYSVTFMLFIQYMYKIELIAPENYALKNLQKKEFWDFYIGWKIQENVQYQQGTTVYAPYGRFLNFFNIVRLRVWLIGKLY